MFVLGSEEIREAKASTSVREMEGEEAGGPEASPGVGGMRAREGGQSMRAILSHAVFFTNTRINHIDTHQC